ncbi:MAG: fibronectin type III domain-containing protein, partial [Bacteroidales bacterium]|nr:fibronectin type III domain-containing protein [Bacteroidales bacterium]
MRKFSLWFLPFVFVLYAFGSFAQNSLNKSFQSTEFPPFDDYASDSTALCTGISGTVGVENITSNSAKVYFEDTNANHSAWKVYYRKVGDKKWIETDASGDKTAELTDLDAAEKYDVFVLTDCSGNISTDTSNIVRFITDALVAELPLDIDFNDKEAYYGIFDNRSNTNDNWYIGSATGTEGYPTALYISNDDGKTTTFTCNNNTNAYSVLTFTFDDKQEQNISFDYKVGGVEADFSSLSVFLLPDTIPVPLAGIPKGATVLVNKVCNKDWTGVSYTTQELAGGTYRLVFYWHVGIFCVNPYDFSAAIDNIHIGGSSCLKPLNLHLAEATAESLKIEWTKNGEDQQAWNVYYRQEGTPQWSELKTVYSDSAVIDGLQVDTRYEVKVTAFCKDEQSAFSDIMIFKTACGVKTIPWFTDFENGYTLDCWTKLSGEDYIGLTEAGAYPRNEDLDVALRIGGGDAVLALPLLEGDLSWYRLTFWYSQDNRQRWDGLDPGTLEVGTLSNLADAKSFKPLTVLEPYNDESDERWHYARISLQDADLTPSADNYIAFRYTSQKGEYGSSLTTWYFDDIRVGLAPTCTGPQSDGVKVSEITDISAKITFADSNEDHRQWNVYYREKGSDEVSFVTTDTFSVVLALNSGTIYDVWVKTQCDQESEDSTEVVRFSTKGAAMRPDFVIDFEQDKIDAFSFTADNEFNAWVIGSATAKDGSKSLYISDDDGENNNYSSHNFSVLHSYAVMNIEFYGKSEYILSFDYKSEGCSRYDDVWADLSVYLVPPDKEIPQTGMPEGTCILSKVSMTDWTEFEYSITGSEDRIMQLVFVWSSTRDSGTGAAIDNIRVRGADCAKPSALVVKGTDDNSAEISWKESGDANKWIVYYSDVADKFTDVADHFTDVADYSDDIADYFTQLTVTDTDYTISSLKENTLYKAYVRAVCQEGDTSDASAVITFRTTQPMTQITSLGYVLDFEDEEESKAVYSYSTATNDWIVGTDAGGHTHALYVSSDKSSYHCDTAVDNYAYATLPLRFGTQQEYDLSFDYKSGGGQHGYMRVYLVPTAVQLPQSGWPEGTLLLDTVSNTDGWQHHSVRLQHVAEKTYQLVFVWYNAAAKRKINPPAAIDNIKITGNDCATPTDLVMTEADDNSATFTWTENGNADAWKFHYRLMPEGEEFVVSAVNVYKNSLNKVTGTLTGLASGVKYSVCVSADCKEVSKVSKEVTFATLGKLISQFPYVQTFEDALQDNAVTVFGSGKNQWYVGDAEGLIDESTTTVPHSLYISSDDGETNSYVAERSYSVAVFNVQFGDAPQYSLDFDYHAAGFESLDNLNVYLIPKGEALPSHNDYHAPKGAVTLMEGRQGTGVNVWRHASYVLDNVSARVYQLVFYWRNASESAYNPAAAIDNIRLEEAKSDCIAVSDLQTVGRRKTDAITVKWKDNNPAQPQSWSVAYGLKNLNVFDTVITDRTECTLTDLESGADYYIFVSANCEDNTPTSVHRFITASTSCLPVDPAEGWYDGFDIKDYDNRSYPVCWERVITSHRDTIYPSVTTYASTGYNGNATSMEFKGNCAIATQYFQGNISHLKLEFSAKRDLYAFASGDMVIYVASDIWDTNTWEPVSVLPYWKVSEWQHDIFAFEFNNVINKGENRAIVLQHTGNSSGSWYLDNFRVTVMKETDNTCETQLKVIKADSIDETTARISWTDAININRWQYKVNLHGMFTSSYDSSVYLTGLTPGTDYTVYVRSYCVEPTDTFDENGIPVFKENGRLSNWDSVTFRTKGVIEECPETEYLAVDTATKNTVAVSWSGETDTYNVVITEEDDIKYVSSDEIKTTDKHNYVFTDLKSSTKYNVYVRSVCQYNNSPWQHVQAETSVEYIAPVVTTADVSDIDSASATLNGTVMLNSDAAVKKGFELIKDKDTIICLSSSLNTVFKYDAADLKSGTEYSYRAFVTNPLGSVFYGQWVKFKTKEYAIKAPVVVTLDVAQADFDSVSAVLRADLIKGGEEISACGFAYKVAGTNIWDTLSANADNFSLELKNLTPNTSYVFYAFVSTTAYSYVTGGHKQFTTLPTQGMIILPEVKTLKARKITRNSAVLAAEVTESTYSEKISSRGFVYVRQGQTDSVTVSVSDREKFTKEINGLQPNTVYVYHAYTVTVTNTVCDATEDTFTTMKVPVAETDPVVRTADASGIDSVKATLNATVTVTETTKAIVSSGFMYRKATDNEYTTVEAAINNGTMTYELTGLTPDTEYQFAGFVNTADGHLMGDIKTFKTL